MLDLDKVERGVNLISVYCEIPCYERLSKIAENHPRKVAAAAPVIGIFVGTITLAKYISHIAECVIKALGNCIKGILTCDARALGRAIALLLLAVKQSALAIPCVVLAVAKTTKAVFMIRQGGEGAELFQGAVNTLEYPSLYSVSEGRHVEDVYSLEILNARHPEML
jgi:hypothetical protein